jgi:predicted nucleotidyltransferase
VSKIPPDDKAPALSIYVEAWRARDRREAAEAAAWRARIRARLPAVVRMLVDDYGVTRVVLFGSLVRDEGRAGSDVDLLVGGLRIEQLLDAAVEAEGLLEEAVADIVRTERARPEICDLAERDGEVLYGP